MLITSEAPLVPEAHERVVRAWRTWQTSPQRYSQLAGQLPQLIVDTESAVQAHQAEAVTSSRHAKGCAADLYGLVRTVTERLGRLDLSLLAADRAMRAADALRPLMAESETDTAAVYGALLLIGAVAVARQGDTWTAHSRL